MRHVLLLAVVLAVATGCACATPLPLDATWAVGSVSQSGEVQTWTYTAAKPVVFRVTDWELTGDHLDIYLDGGWLFSTPDVPLWQGWTADIDLAYADPRWSSGSAVLPTGSHSIDVRMWADAGVPAGYAVQGSLVPEPSSLVLLGVGALGTLLPLRLRRRK